MNAKLSINGVEIVLGHKALTEMTYCLQDNHENSDFFREMAKSNCSELLTALVDKKHLSKLTLRLLIENGSLEVMRAVVCSRNAISHMTRRDIESYISTGDCEILTSLANNIVDFTETYEVCEKEWLCEKLARHSDPAIRYALAENTDTPEGLLEELVEDDDVDVARQAEETLADIREEELS
jgi:hypothetical protein